MGAGSILYIVEGDSFARLYTILSREGIMYRELHEEGGKLSLRVSLGHCRRFEKACHEAGYRPEQQEVYGAIKLGKFMAERAGLVVGAVISALLMMYYSDVILRIDIDTEDPVMRGKIIDVLKEDGVTAGAYLPDIDLVLEERSLKSKIDDLAWVGLTRTGSGIAVDIIEEVRAEKGITKGMPCHLVACEDGVIEEIELLDGQLLKGIGSGVTKGDMVVSGKIVTENSEWTRDGEVIEIKTRYARSIGKIRGTFVRTMVFEQPYDREVKVLTGNSKTLRYLDLFSAEIPLFAEVPEGWYEADSEERHFPEVGGFYLPMGITEIYLNEFDNRSQLMDEEEAFAEAEKSAYRYEQNFLSKYEILDRKCQKETDDNGVRLTVTYELYGDLCKESDFFIPKNIIRQEDEQKEKNVQHSENN
ncbi:sporulation protein YqfD [Ruminococcus sp.]|uniref:sporulation protein YqfD n=1 Tax=Ruminococcus sp. TaxID=41978 RepID=UPI0025CE98F7|nr:sporulation protein YqfD [Ruminococcus sp.]MBQ8965335.1 sporulation protein YqfD [Ruminococcus sp.]